MKRAYLAKGALIANAKLSDNVFSVDSALFGYVSSLLDGDYCYLTISKEVVKVLGTQAPDKLLVQRNVSGFRAAYLVGESVKYAVTANEILDAVETEELSISVDGALDWKNGVISYPYIDLNPYGGITVDGTVIRDIPENAGCCDNSGAVQIPLQYGRYRITTDGKYRKTTLDKLRAYK